MRALLQARGLDDPRILDAVERVPREAFVPAALAEYAYEDAPLPIGAGQTISQPFVVALTAARVGLEPGAKVLEVGTGSGYAAAIYAEVVGPEGAVYTVERFADLAEDAQRRLEHLGYRNVHVRTGDGTLGWGDHAPFDAIAVAAGGPVVPRALRRQLRVGGVLVIPVGATPRSQRLMRVHRTQDGFEEEDLGPVRFVPLVGYEGWPEGASKRREAPEQSLPEAIAAQAEPFADVDAADLAPLLERIGDRRVVLLGESTHGTAEFYRMRAAISRALIEEKGFRTVALEADWPDAARIDAYVRDVRTDPQEWRAFSRFPTWMWRNREFREFVDWLREHNMERPPEERVAVRGLDLYSMYTSMDAVIRHLDKVDPRAADVARERYGCLSPWEQDPATYARVASRGKFADCEDEVVAMLDDLLTRQRTWSPDGDRFLDATQNARLVRNAERYYRTMYRGGRESWNLRDGHMFETLQMLLDEGGPESRAVVWAHNSHVGDARATEMGRQGEHNLGQLCREGLGADATYLVGFGTHTGTVAAADAWDGPVQIQVVRPSHEKSYERLAHETDLPGFFLPIRPRDALSARLMEPRLQRAIGVVYRPDTEVFSHYFQASLPRQFDELVWVDETRAVTPLSVEELRGVPETYPFGV